MPHSLIAEVLIDPLLMTTRRYVALCTWLFVRVSAQTANRPICTQLGASRRLCYVVSTWAEGVAKRHCSAKVVMSFKCAQSPVCQPKSPSWIGRVLLTPSSAFLHSDPSLKDGRPHQRRYAQKLDCPSQAADGVWCRVQLLPRLA
jgi:hypothetical protein